MEINWKNGLTRIYIIIVVLWFGYWFIWVPIDMVHSWQDLAAGIDDESLRLEYYSKGTLINQYKDLFEEIVRSPLVSIVVLILPPILGYFILLGLIKITGWLASGFKNH